jgi:hypothetical protein
MYGPLLNHACIDASPSAPKLNRPDYSIHPVASVALSPTPTLRTLLRYITSEAWALAPTASNTGKLRDMVSNPLDPDLMTASERLEEAASLLARGILRRRLGESWGHTTWESWGHTT